MSRVIRMAAVVAAIVVAIVVALAAPATARVVQVEGPDDERVKRNPVVYVERLSPRWSYVELADGSTWRATDCRYEDSRNCLWDARTAGNGRGDTFLDLRGNAHYFRAPVDVRVTVSSRCRDGANVYTFRFRNVGDVRRTVRYNARSVPADPQLGSATGAFRVRAGDIVTDRHRIRRGHERVTYRSQGRVIMRADMTRGGCGR